MLSIVLDEKSNNCSENVRLLINKHNEYFGQWVAFGAAISNDDFKGRIYE